jgi:hypothetical protein
MLSSLCSVVCGFIFLNRGLQWKIIGTGHVLPMAGKVTVTVDDTAGL